MNFSYGVIMLPIISFFLPLLLCIASTAQGECKGRIDLGPAFASVDMLESGKTKRTLNLWGIKGDATLQIWQGLCIKPSFLCVDGKANLNSGSIGIGFCIPLSSTLSITPAIGFTETQFKSRIDFPHWGLFHLREKFLSRGIYASIDGCWSFAEKWRLYALFQYSGSYVRTTIRPLAITKAHVKGPNYAAAIERDLASNLSLCLALGYNLSLSKEKHGLRGKGIKLGLVYWF